MPILNWLTREEDIRTASSVPCRMLIEGPTVSTGDPDAENALIHSDNLNQSQGEMRIRRIPGHGD